MTAKIQFHPPRQDAERRVSDAWGAGHFGASRGDRTHKGIDFLIPADSTVYSAATGTVSKIGRPYADSPFRYVEVKDVNGNRIRHFYVNPTVRAQDRVFLGAPIGLSQDLSTRYPGDKSRGPMPNHMHLEIKTATGDYLDPDDYLFT